MGELGPLEFVSRKLNYFRLGDNRGNYSKRFSSFIEEPIHFRFDVVESAWRPTYITISISGLVTRPKLNFRGISRLVSVEICSKWRNVVP